MNVLIIGHACGPGLGSEPGFTWNWAQFLSLEHRVWVLCHPQHRASVEAFMLANPNPNLEFIWITLESRFDPWQPERGEKGIRVHYLRWLPKAYDQALSLCRTLKFDIAHHVSWGAVGAPPPLWRLPMPTVWGPIGGGQCVPPAFRSFLGRGKWAELARTMYVRMLPFTPSLRKAAKRAALVLTTNQDTERLLKRIAGVNVMPFLDCGLPPSGIPTKLPSDETAPEFTLFSAGRLEPRKGLPLTLQALAQTKAPAKLLIAGSGYLRPGLEEQVRQLGLESRVEFLGSVPYERMQSLFRSSHAFIFTSLRDSFGSVVLEAMAQGLPIIALNHQGVGTFVPDNAGIKVPVTTPGETIQALAAAIDEMASAPKEREQMRVNAWSFAREQTWARRAERMTEIYQDLILRRRR